MSVLRKEGRLIGVGFCSDESPPAAPRYAGLRFQITIVYIVVFEAEERWEAPDFDSRPPFTREPPLCDVMNAPSKTGKAAFDVIKRQIETKGLSVEEAVSGAGADGGENEGCAGVHAIME